MIFVCGVFYDLSFITPRPVLYCSGNNHRRENAMPLIGLTANWNDTTMRSDIPGDYVSAVIAAGGTPVVLPVMGDETVWQRMVDAVDGIVFTGGNDIDAAFLGEEKHPKSDEPYRPRDEQEFFLLRAARKADKPFLCICRGFQVLNVLEGGSLYQDIADQFCQDIDHAQFKRVSDAIHTVEVAEGSLLSSLTGTGALPVNSRHHQGIRKAADTLRAAAVAPDGLIEALEYRDGTRCIATQWHPESLFRTDSRALAIFEWLIREAQA